MVTMDGSLRDGPLARAADLGPGGAAAQAKVGFWSSSVSADLVEAAMTAPASTIPSVLPSARGCP
jgi:hypothetical protein